jgi:enhancer of polycomb-like protein
VEYNLDEEDETWLENQPLFGLKINQRKMGDTSVEEKDLHVMKPILSLAIFERMIDVLEKATAFETIITLHQAERLVLGKIPSILRVFPSSHVNKGEQKKKDVVTVKTVVDSVYNYWVQKRSKMKKPLLRKFWPVTATNDTNPHLVFRPREKEKYKLRKKRQNDLDAYKKIKQLKADFQEARVLLELIKRREILNKCVLNMENDWFDQRIYELVDTSGIPRESDRLSREEIETALNVPKFVDTEKIASKINKKRKKCTGTTNGGHESISPTFGIAESDYSIECTTGKKVSRIAADQDHPVSFIHPLRTRETYTTSWDDAVPFVTSYTDSKATSTTRFRHRPRIGRGGRVIIDRIPKPVDEKHPQLFIVGLGTQNHSNDSKQAARLLDLLPEPLDRTKVSQRIESISAMAMVDDEEKATKTKLPSAPSQGANISEDIPTEDVLVKIKDWIETDEQVWGEEMSVLGPV